MSFREKIAWSCLATTLLVFVPYFVYVFQLSGRNALHTPLVVPALVAAIATQAVLNIVAAAAIALLSRPERKDERDAAIESRSFRYAYGVLAVSMVTAVGAAIFVPAADSGTRLALMSQVMLLCFVAAEATKYL